MDHKTRPNISHGTKLKVSSKHTFYKSKHLEPLHVDSGIYRHSHVGLLVSTSTNDYANAK